MILFANGHISHPQLEAERIQPEDVLIAADGGARHCLAMGIVPDHVVGDFDSLLEDELRSLDNAGADLHSFPAQKDETDLELALKYALDYAPDKIIILGALGDRWDMTFANLLLIAHPDYQEQSIQLQDGPQTLSLLRSGQTRSIQGQVGDTVSLIPLLGDTKGVSTQGLEYVLHDEALEFGSPRGVSNVMQSEEISIQVKSGLLLVVHIANVNDKLEK